MPNSDEIVQHESTPPQPVLINPPVEASSISRQDHTEETEQSIVFIRSPKFRHPTRIISSALVTIGILVYFISFIVALDGNSDGWFNIGYGTCCMFFNAAFVCEIIFYYNMIQHNQSYGQGTGWAITNIVLAVFLIVVGTLGMLSILFAN